MTTYYVTMELGSPNWCCKFSGQKSFHQLCQTKLLQLTTFCNNFVFFFWFIVCDYHIIRTKTSTIMWCISLSSLSQSLFESRRSQGRSSEHVGKPLTTSCSDVWLARKGHVIKPPSGSFHSHDFQIVMGFILSGVFPR